MKCLATCRERCRRAEAASTVRATCEDGAIWGRCLYIFRPNYIHVVPCRGDLLEQRPRSRRDSILAKVLGSPEPGPVVCACLEKYVVCSSTIVLPGDIAIARRDGHHGGGSRPVIAKVELADREGLAIVSTGAKQYVRRSSCFCLIYPRYVHKSPGDSDLWQT